jgi:DNA-binding response OmpR family regulator
MRLLVVEDDRDLNRQLVTALENAGYAMMVRKGIFWAIPSPTMA